MTEPQQQTPAEALEAIRQSRAVVADKVAHNSRTYDLIYSSIAAVMVGGQVAPFPLNVLASTGACVGFVVLARKWAQKNGVFVSGVTPKRARWVAVGLGAVFVVLMLASVWSGQAGKAWLGIPLGVVAFLLAGAGSRLWLRVFRAETQDPK
jgi:hypothetical protein